MLAEGLSRGLHPVATDPITAGAGHDYELGVLRASDLYIETDVEEC